MEDQQNITLKSSDEQEFKVMYDVIKQSKMIADTVEDTSQKIIPLNEVKGRCLEKIIEYCNYYHEIGLDDEHLQPEEKKAKEQQMKLFEQNFFRVEQSILYELTLASNYLDINDLFLACCMQVCSSELKDKSDDELRQIFDFSAFQTDSPRDGQK